MKKVLPFLIIVFVILSVQMVLSSFEKGSYQVYAFHTDKEINQYNKIAAALPSGFNSIFAGSGECNLCHGKAGGGPNPTANQDANGNDISPVSDWKATMMANSAKDPFWRAKVSHEVLVNPSLQQDIESTCTKCHAPNGFFDAIHNGQPHYSISDMLQDSIALDGVTCTSCHSMLPDGLGSVFSAGMKYDTNKTIYGPYSNPFTNPMVNMIGFTPTQGSHINSSEMCGACHTLITHPVDLNGNPLGTHYVEQAIYHEWENSSYAQSPQTSCQDCHIPRTNDNVVISDRPPWLGSRTPFGKHFLVGGNAFMLNLLKDNIDTLGLSATPTEFDTVINRTINQLQNKTLDISLAEVNRINDTAYYSIELTNKAGHKFPAGYPSRRAYIDFIVKNNTGDTLFHSGKADNQYRLLNESTTYEPHYNIINADTQVQIYEMVMGDVNSDVTTVLERAYVTLKDNRIAPLGFTSTHSNYDTVKVLGLANTDPNFNKSVLVEGTGKDSVFYNVHLNGYTGPLNVTATVYYQAVPPKWTDEMFTFSSSEIDLFKSLYDSADHTPIIVASANLNTTNINTLSENKLALYPNPTNNTFYLEGLNDIGVIKLYNCEGKLVKITNWNGKQKQSFSLPNTKGIYFLKISYLNGRSSSHKILHN